MEGINQGMFNVVSIMNVDTQDFLIEYNISDPINGYRAIMPSGATVSLPKFIADHAVEGITDQVLNRQGKSTNNVAVRAALRQKIIISTQRMSQPLIKTPEQQAIEDIQPVQTAPRLESIAPVAPVVEPTVPNSTPLPPQGTATPPPDENVEEFAGLISAPEQPNAPVHNAKPDADGNIPGEIDTTDENIDTTPVKKAPPTRAELFTYAEQTLGMDLSDNKTLARFARLTDAELTTELDYPVNE